MKRSLFTLALLSLLTLPVAAIQDISLDGTPISGSITMTDNTNSPKVIAVIPDKLG